MSRSIALQSGTTQPAMLSSVSPSRDGSRAQMAHAKLQLYDSSPAQAGKVGGPGAAREAIDFQFNPKEVTIQKSAKWERQPAKGASKAGPPEYKGPEPCKLTMEMFFDASSHHHGKVVKVVDAVEKLFACCVPTKESAGDKLPKPPVVVLRWGEVSSFPAYVSSVSAKYTLFSAAGTPIRALCSVTMEELPNEPWRQNPTSGGLSVQRAHTTIDGDTLASIAFAEYGDPTLWRPLAAFNSIDDPLRLSIGSLLLLPSSTDLR
jgi:nucleoid-associated protein YgaU